MLGKEGERKRVKMAVLAEIRLAYLVHKLRYVIHETVNDEPYACRYGVVLRYFVPRVRLPSWSRHYCCSTDCTVHRGKRGRLSPLGGEVRVIRILCFYGSGYAAFADAIIVGGTQCFTTSKHSFHKPKDQCTQ